MSFFLFSGSLVLLGCLLCALIFLLTMLMTDEDCKAQQLCKADAVDCRHWRKLIKDVVYQQYAVGYSLVLK